MARDATRVVRTAERTTLQRLLRLLEVIEREWVSTAEEVAREAESTTSRIIRELNARRRAEQATAARRMLSLGDADGELARLMRENIQTTLAEAQRAAVRNAASTGVITAAQAAAFTPRVELTLLQAILEGTTTRLRHVTTDGARRIQDVLVREAVRGAGPRAAARAVRNQVDVTRYEAERITRTVFNTANNLARDATWDALGVEYLQWNASADERLCEYCAARNGMVYRRSRAPTPPLHPHCRCVMTPWSPSTPPERRGDAYYERVRRDRRESGEPVSTATAAGPFDKANGVTPPEPVWAPGRGWL